MSTRLLFGAHFLRDRQRWVIVALLCLTTMVNSIDRQALSVMAATLKDELNFGSVEYSYVVASFLTAYSIGYTFCGRVLDRIGVKVGLAVALGFWSLSGMLHAAAIGWITLAICRFLLGLGESFNSPAGVKAIAEWVPPRERGLSMSIFSNGGILGAVVTPPLVAFTTLHFGWRWSFLITGALGLVLLVIWWRTYETPSRHPRITPSELDYIKAHSKTGENVASPASMWTLLRYPLCWAMFLARFLTDSINYFFGFWLPDYLQNERGFSLALIGMVAWIPFVAADIGGPGGGAISDFLIRRGWSHSRARRMMMALAACLTPAALLAVRVEVAWQALVLIAIVVGAQSCWMANQLTFISESVERQNVGTMLSLSALGGSLGGILSTLVAGRVIADFGYTPVFTALGFLHLTAFCVIAFAVHLTRKRGSPV